MPFSFFVLVFSQCSPQYSNPTAATTVKSRSLLPGVTTLFRDLDRRPILGASKNYYLLFL